jgi:single-strand DNA-binding protein
MPNVLHFDGRLAKPVTLTGQGDRQYAKFTLIRNQYAGKDDQTGDTREKTVAVQFTAFRGKAEAIARNCFKGDQLFITAHVENNDYTDVDGVQQYGHEYIVEDFDFGAPGPEKRAALAARQQTGAAAPA